MEAGSCTVGQPQAGTRAINRNVTLIGSDAVINRSYYNIGKNKVDFRLGKEPLGPWNNYLPAQWGPDAYYKTLDKHSFTEPDCHISHYAWLAAVNRVEEVLRTVGQSGLVSEPDKPDWTSPGYPFILPGGSHWPYTPYFPTSADVYEYFPNIREDLWEDIEDGLRPYWYVFLKKEQVHKRKVNDGEVRAIYVPPDPWSRNQCVYDQDMNCRLKKHALQIPMAVGFSPFWDTDQMARIFDNSYYVVEKDYKRFDGTIPASVLYVIRRLRFEALQPQYQTDWHWRRYSSLSEAIICKDLIHPTGCVYRVTCGNPSGQVSTSIDNCLANIFVTEYVHQVVYGQPYQALVTYGDDTLQGYAIRPRIQEEQYVLEHHLGMCLKECKVQDTIEGLSFCGYSISKRRGRWVPLYNPNRILANLWRPVSGDNSDDVLWGRLVCATLLLWETEHRHIPYDLLKKLFLGKSGWWVPTESFFDDIFYHGWRWTESAQDRLVQVFLSELEDFCDV